MAKGRSRPTGQQSGSQTIKQDRTPLELALGYAARGWHVFPLKPGSKDPATPHGFKDATTDREQIEAWWTATPDANIGIATGAISGIIVLDPDGPEGEETLAKLERELDQLPETYTVHTPGDSSKGKLPGRHIYLHHPGGKLQNRRGRDKNWNQPGFDVRGDGGYVVAAGSVRPDGPYTENGDGRVAKLGNPPAGWTVLLRDGKAPTKTTNDDEHLDDAGPVKLAGRGARRFTEKEATAYWQTEAIDRIEKHEHGRNRSVYEAGIVLGHFVPPRFLDEEGSTETLVELAEAIGLDEAEARRQIANGIAVGKEQPYEIIGLDQHQDPGPGADKRAQAIRDAVMDSTELDQLPEPKPMLAGYLNEAEAVWLAGKFGSYKSLVALAWSYAVATGTPWSGAEVAKVVPVVYVAAEGVSGLKKRLRALERYYGKPVPPGMLTIIRRPIHLERPEEVAVLREVIEAKNAKLVAMDTWHRMAGRVDENSNTEQGNPIDIALSLRDDYQATVLILDHTGHAQQHARGASAKEDDVDASWLIKLGKGDAEEESRAISTPRTLVHRKAKDEEVRDPELLQLLVDDQREAVVIVNPVQPAAPIPGRKKNAQVTYAEQVKELVQRMDEHQIPLDEGYRTVMDWDATLRPGFSASQKATQEAIRVRRGRKVLLGKAKEELAELGVDQLPEREAIEPARPCPKCGGTTMAGPAGERFCAAGGSCNWEERAS
jgi:Bifunctional DNA primase/polymerase, N-terminal/AAA domain